LIADLFDFATFFLLASKKLHTLLEDKIKPIEEKIKLTHRDGLVTALGSLHELSFYVTRHGDIFSLTIHP
jgi:hypothetical protein